MGQYFHLLRIKEEHCTYFHLTFAGNKYDVKQYIFFNNVQFYSEDKTCLRKQACLDIIYLYKKAYWYLLSSKDKALVSRL